MEKVMKHYVAAAVGAVVAAGATATMEPIAAAFFGVVAFVASEEFAAGWASPAVVTA